MKVFLLSAGKGERLGQLTKDTPKCVLPVAGKSMIEHWYYLFELYYVNEVFINLSYFPEKVIDVYKKLFKYKVRTTFCYEKELLGTAKTVYKNRDYIRDDNNFMIIYVDTWMQIDLKAMYSFHRKRDTLATLGIYSPKDLKDQGIITIEGRKITSIEEKPKSPKSGFAFAGVMIVNKEIFKTYNENMIDLAKDWLPAIKNYVSPFFINGLVYDIGTPERYEIANREIQSLGLKSL